MNFNHKQLLHSYMYMYHPETQLHVRLVLV